MNEVREFATEAYWFSASPGEVIEYHPDREDAVVEHWRQRIAAELRITESSRYPQTALAIAEYYCETYQAYLRGLLRRVGLLP